MSLANSNRTEEKEPMARRVLSESQGRCVSFFYSWNISFKRLEVEMRQHIEIRELVEGLNISLL
jgi:hypothetical protein